MCNNIHALCKRLCAPLVCMCVHALGLRASLLPLINNSPVLLVRLPSFLHPLPQLTPLSSLLSLTSSPLSPSPKHHPKACTHARAHTHTHTLHYSTYPLLHLYSEVTSQYRPKSISMPLYFTQLVAFGVLA